MATDLRERVRTALVELRANARVYRNIRKLLPTAPYNPARFLQRWADERPNNQALRFEDQVYTWSEFNDRANQYAAFFWREGVRAGNVVALLMTNRPDFLFAILGLNKLGAVGALINTNLTHKALAHAINVADPQHVLVGAELIGPLLEALPDLEGNTERLWVQAETADADSRGQRVINDDIDPTTVWEAGALHQPKNSEVYCYIYTSGTTGLPKAAVITNQRMLAAAHLFGEAMIESGPGECTYVSLPLYHSSAMYIGFGSALAMGGSIALARKFSASRFWQDVVKHDATAVLYIGELCRYLLNQQPSEFEGRHRVKVAVGNGLRPDIWIPFQERFGVPVCREFYGATEGNAPVMNFEGRPGMVGRRRRGQVLVRCDQATGDMIRNADGFCDEIGPGEIGLMLGKISAVMKFDGYVDKKASSKKIVRNIFKPGDQYFNTGDLIQLHDNGWLSFADRIGDTFRWKGENVSTNEVAEILNGCDGVLEANVYGVKVPHTDGRAGMVALSTDRDFDLEAFASYVLAELPKYQRPYFVRMLDSDEMRTTTTLKHQKVDYRREGFDPEAIDDPLYFLAEDKYVPIDTALYGKIDAGDISP